MYYHLIIDIANSSNKLTEYNMRSRDNLIDNILLPYLTGNNFTINTLRINSTIINDIKIYASYEKINEFLLSKNHDDIVKNHKSYTINEIKIIDNTNKIFDEALNRIKSEGLPVNSKDICNSFN